MGPSLWNGNGQRILGQLRNFGGSGQESCSFHSLDLLRLCQLQLVKHLTLESIWASFKEAFSPPGDAAEQKKSRGTAPAVSRSPQQLFCNLLAHRQLWLQWATSLPTYP